MSNLSRKLTSKTGLAVIAVVVVLVIVVAVVVTQSNLTGGAGAPPPPAPAVWPAPGGDGWTCMPSCDPIDGKFFTTISPNSYSFTGAKITMWIGVGGDKTSFQVGFFDGDAGKDINGAYNWALGNWDGYRIDTTYTLYADPLRDYQGMTVLATWTSDQMANNQWTDFTVNTSPEAKAPSGHYIYRLETTYTPNYGVQRFKVHSTGFLGSGNGGDQDGGLPLVGGGITDSDYSILYPQWQDDNHPGESYYTGEWFFYFTVPVQQKTITVWDGDFDRGTTPAAAQDTDDTNTQGKPPWAGPKAVNERAGLKGNPADNSNVPYQVRGIPVQYVLLDPNGASFASNPEPSGTEEWEQYCISTDPAAGCDVNVSSITPGLYTFQITGLDAYNFAWIKTNYCLSSVEEGCGPPVYKEEFCPRTIGYWKNNVKKVLIEGRTNGVQETTQSLTDALKFIAMTSPLYRSGINVAAPVAIANPVPLTKKEANAIMQKNAGNSMMDRALQQNLATWFNLATGKIGQYTWVVINTPSGTYEGTLMGALLTAQDIILNGGNLEYAKDIADMINNGQVNVDPDSNLDSSGNPVCTIYDTVIPKDKQPPKTDKLPKGPKPNPPKTVPPAPPPPDPNTCVGSRANTYNVESPTNNPFYGIKFEYTAGTEVKGSDSEVFQYTLSKDAVAAMTAMQVEAKAGQEVSVLTLTCDFTSPLLCDPAIDPDKFGVQFMGAVDNGDGTVTLTFQVTNYTSFGLSHATFELPAGVVPTTPTGTYTAKACP